MIFKIAIYLISQLISLYALVMLIYCLTTWFIRDPANRFVRFLAFFTEPPLEPIRRLLRRFSYFENSPVDFSPLILFFLLRILMNLLSRIGSFL